MKHRIVLSLALLSFFLPNVIGQDHDHSWLVGYLGGSSTPNDTTFGISMLSFSEQGLSVENNQEIEMWFDNTNASICDEEGNLLFYFNGVYIEDSTYTTMENGEELNPWNQNGYDLPQGGLIIPDPGNAKQYYLFHAEQGYIDLPGWTTECVGLYYSLISFEDNPLGRVELKKEPVFIDTLMYGKLTATRHANGRDWWLLVNESHTNRFHSLLLSPDGLDTVAVQEAGVNEVEGLGQAVFSPDGSKYVYYSAISAELGAYLDIYDFERCTGELLHKENVFFTNDVGPGGVAISPNSRFLYVPMGEFIYQYDLLSDNIMNSETLVAEYDGFLSPFPTLFFHAQIGPDNKIYVVPRGGSRVMHVIHNPDEKGMACNVEQHGVHLPTANGASIPNFPNYRLGPIDGSTCDTLGIDNFPVAKYRYEQDSLDYLKIAFTDLSHHEPAEWQWDFGDNMTSQDTSPVHTYISNGTYDVCLTVSNNFGEHTKCHTLNIGVTSSSEVPNLEIDVYPNPVSKKLNLVLPKNYLPKSGSVHFYNALGNNVADHLLSPGWNILDMGDLSPGIYFYDVFDGNILLKSGKVIKTD